MNKWSWLTPVLLSLILALILAAKVDINDDIKRLETTKANSSDVIWIKNSLDRIERKLDNHDRGN